MKERNTDDDCSMIISRINIVTIVKWWKPEKLHTFRPLLSEVLLWAHRPQRQWTLLCSDNALLTAYSKKNYIVKRIWGSINKDRWKRNEAHLDPWMMSARSLVIFPDSTAPMHAASSFSVKSKSLSFLSNVALFTSMHFIKYSYSTKTENCACVPG